MSIAKIYKKVDQFLDKKTPLILLFFIIIFLRLPNFFEPYWYGDEAIYLTLGNALREGGKLYTTIIDHKTPLIYYLAMVPSQFYFRVLNLVWMMITSFLFFRFSKKLFKKEHLAFFTTLLMVLLTTLPWLEGHIPNGELFVMGFVMLGANIFSGSSIFENFFRKETKIEKINIKEISTLVFSGILFSLGILTKVPALLDLAGFLVIFWLILAAQFFNEKNSAKKIMQIFAYLLSRGIIFAIGVALPIIASILYFKAQGRLQDYLDYGLLYNIRYSQSWSQDFGSKFLNFSFSLAGKTIYLFAFVVLLTLNSNELSKRFQFISAWTAFTLYAVLLSSRPYPHYFIQMVPAFALLVTETFTAIPNLLKAKKKEKLENGKVVITATLFMTLIAYIMLVFNFQPYSVKEYYSKFNKYALGKISKEKYENSFDGLVKDNREVAKLIKEMGIKKMFIWGTNPMLYAQTQTVPTSRFTVSFHIKDFNDYDRTFSQIEKEEPKLIIIMNNEDYQFEKLNNYLKSYYLPNTEYQTMTLYLRQEAL